MTTTTASHARRAPAPKPAPNRKPMLARFYWPAWAAVFRVGWALDRGTVLPNRLREDPVAADLPTFAEIEGIADRLRGPCRMTADHLRHACHVRALGRDKSATALTPEETDRVVALFQLLADPLSLDAMQAWLNPDAAVRRRLVWRMERHGMPEDYVAAICRDRFGAPDWKGLTTPQLRHLVMTLDQRARSAHRATRNSL